MRWSWSIGTLLDVAKSRCSKTTEREHAVTPKSRRNRPLLGDLCCLMHDWTQCAFWSCFQKSLLLPSPAMPFACQDAGLSSALGRLLDARRCVEELLVRKAQLRCRSLAHGHNIWDMENWQRGLEFFSLQEPFCHGLFVRLSCQAAAEKAMCQEALRSCPCGMQGRVPRLLLWRKAK